MKITYEYLTGETVEIEVDEQFGEVVLELDRKEYNNNRKETRRHVLLSAINTNSKWFASDKDDPGADRNIWKPDGRDEYLRSVVGFMPDEKTRKVIYLYSEGYSMKECGEIIGMTESGVSKKINRLRKKIKK